MNICKCGIDAMDCEYHGPEENASSPTERYATEMGELWAKGLEEWLRAASIPPLDKATGAKLDELASLHGVKR